MKRMLFIMYALLLQFGSVAQTTGSFDLSITLSSQPRTLSFFVPATYTPAVPHRLVIALHGLGDNSGNFRTAIINSLGYAIAMPNTIFVFPDGGNDQLRDFYTPAGDEAIIDTAIARAVSMYAIDASQILLEGFSLGGRSALRYGLTHPQRFKGLMLHTPAMQGVKDALNAATFSYNSAPGLPVYVTHGGADVLYTAAIDTMMELLVKGNARVRLQTYPSMGHAVPPATQMPGLLSWFDAQVTPVTDAEVFRLYAPDRSCNTQVTAAALIRNTGTTVLDSVSLQLTTGSGTVPFIYKGTLQPYQHAIVNFPAAAVSAGTQSLTATVQQVNNGLPDTIFANNQRSTTFIRAVSPGSPVPLHEGFDSPQFPPQGWVSEQGGDVMTLWDYDNTVMQSGAGSIYSFNTILLFDTRDRRATLYSPLIHTGSTANAGVSFDLCYNYHRYTPPYFTDTTDFSDTLEVGVSYDCGNTYQVLYRKAGADLATFPSPIINPLNVNAAFTNPTAANWKRIQIPFNTTQPEAIVRFSYISGIGGCINIDNVRVDNLLSVKDQEIHRPRLMPNPATTEVAIQLEGVQAERISLTDIQGRIVQTVQVPAGAASLPLAVGALPAGIYLVHIDGKHGRHTERLLIQR